MACPPFPSSRLKKASTSASPSPPKAANAPGAPTAELSAANPPPWATAWPSNLTPSPRRKPCRVRLDAPHWCVKTHPIYRFLHQLPATRIPPYNKTLMTAASASTHESSTVKSKPVHDPEHYRMSIGDHLEELRWRMIF